MQMTDDQMYNEFYEYLMEKNLVGKVIDEIGVLGFYASISNISIENSVFCRCTIKDGTWSFTGGRANAHLSHQGLYDHDVMQ
jgi:hypothetical protein